MTALMETLFQYAQENKIRALLEEERECARAYYCADKQEEALRALIGEAAGERLDKMLQERELIQFMHERAFFRAGFQLAAELLR